MEHISDLLARRHIEEPREVQIIKQFVQDNYHTAVSVAMLQQQITIGVPGAALAGALRPRLVELKRLCDTDKRLVIRIGR